MKDNSIFELKENQEKKPKVLFTLIDEPLLVFGNNGKNEDPKAGVTNHGPFSYNSTIHPKQIKIGFVGTGETIDLAKRWCEICSSEINAKEGTELKKLFQGFEGFNTTFKSEFIYNDIWNNQISRNDIDSFMSLKNKLTAFNHALEIMVNKIRDISEQDNRPDVIIVALPQEIEDYYKTVGKQEKDKKSKLTYPEKRLREKLIMLRNQGQKDLFGMLINIEEQERILIQKNFRRAFKAKVMEFNIPTQIFLPSTLGSATNKQDIATRAWNFCSAIYYKAGGIPWNLPIERDTCFIGISFYRHLDKASFTMHTSLAQVFTDKGDFLVLRGSKFKWDINQGKSPHLSYDNAKDLIKQVLDKYKEKNKKLPMRVVVHKSSKYLPEELKGFLEPLKDVEQYDLVTLYPTGIRFLRAGDYPVLRGTYCSIANQAHFLFTQGYVPYLETYPKNYIPEPLEIVQHIGDSTKKKICEEIMALSKMNWNNADYSNKMPITLSFAHRVGEILYYIPEKDIPNPSYKFYM